MGEIVHNYISFRIDFMMIFIRLLIGLTLLFNVKLLSDKKKNIIICIYYGVINCGIIGAYALQNIAGVIIGGGIGIILACLIYRKAKSNVLFFGMVWMLMLDALDLVFYKANINFSEILEKYDDIYREYWSIYAKFIILIVISTIVVVGCLAIYKIKVEDRVLHLLIGNQFIIGAIFASTGLPMEEPDTFKDIAIPLLNVNMSQECYLIPILEVVVMVTITLCMIINKRKQIEIL